MTQTSPAITPTNNVGSRVINGVFIPTLVAQSYLIVDYRWLGIICYLAFVTAAIYPSRLFSKFKTWPRTTVGAVLTGPLVLALAYCFPVDLVGYWALLPGFIYLCLCWVGGVALQRSEDSKSRKQSNT
jgi:hypothetical protein